ncbi:histidine kinase [Kribbella italica]|uniref:Two-component system sensor histidine kinase DesK n=1 Tax=Kribbella italica TaxID=1540520 RepID=A0A7W9MUQ6_9ACTN|nr:two-component system sensor histidine kinase DesK [Kribbella italica]
MTHRATDEFSVRRWPDWTFLGERGSIQRTRVAASLSLGVPLVLVSLRTADLVADRYDGPHVVLAAALIGCYVVACLSALWFGPLAPRRVRVGLVATMFGFGAAPAALLNAPVLLTDLTFAIALALMLLPLRGSLPLGLATAAGQVCWMWAGPGPVDWRAVVMLVAVTVALGFVLALSFTIGQLRAARAQVRQLAVDAERERLARDLHDILGHSLSTITVKLGLARRQLEVAADLDSALNELRELESLSRQALSDVRATVSGYRDVSLTAELAGARLALRAAGVRADLPTAADNVRPDLQAVFAYVLREGATNILRHSNATRCTLRLGPHHLELINDGTAAADPKPGNGLTGLAGRLAAVSGTLEHGPTADGGFRLRAEAPSSS